MADFSIPNEVTTTDKKKATCWRTGWQSGIKVGIAGEECEAEMRAEDITDSWGSARRKLCGMSMQRCSHRNKTSPACACVHSQCEIAEHLSTNNLGIQHSERTSWLHVSAATSRVD